MVDFRSQLAKGLSAHEKATAANDEISAVLRELDAQVADFTNNRVGITLQKEIGSLIAGTISGITIGGSLSTGSPVFSEHALVAFDKSIGAGSAKRLASWSQASTGYPCSLRFGNAKRDAYDRKSLEQVLGDLLATPETGRAISEITNLSAKVAKSQ